MTNFNERTNPLLYKIISLTLHSRKGWCFLCVRGELETGIDCYILTQSSSDHSSTSFSSWLGCSTAGHWGAKAFCLPLALNSASCPQLTPTATGTDPSRLWHLVIWLSYVYLLLLFLCLFTQMHFLIDGSVEGQYITHLLLICTLCWVLNKEVSCTIFEPLIWLDLGLNPGLPGNWRTLYTLGHWPSMENVQQWFGRRGSILGRTIPNTKKGYLMPL